MTTSAIPQLLLAGQAAAHPGPVDMNVMYLMHHGFRRDLSRFLAAARLTPVEDRATWRALGGRWDFFAWLLHVHHAGEDEELWPFLRALADAEGAATLDAMEAEHAEIDPILEACGTGFATLATRSDADVRHALVGRLSAARERLGAHLAHEEQEGIALVQALMTQRDWSQVEQGFRRHTPPLRLLQIVPWILSGLPEHVVEVLRAQPGSAPQRVVARLTSPRFERRERVAFRYALGAGPGERGAWTSTR